MGNSDKILVVDDETVIQELLSDILADEGYDVLSAPNGIEAIGLLEERDDFVVLFTDIQMPQMDGIQLIHEAKKIRPAIIPIVMTGYATLETARAAVKEGAYDYVLKPFSLTEIKLAMTNALERHRLTNENARLREVTELFNISEAIASIREEQRLLDFVLRAALERVNAERGSLMATMPDGQHLEVVASVGIPAEAAHSVVRLGSSISGWVAKTNKPLLVEDIQQNPTVAELSHRLQDSSFVSVPLEHRPSADGKPHKINGDQPHVLAVLNVNQKRDGGQFNEGDLKMLSIIANHAAAAIENVRLLQHLEQAHLATLQSMALLLEAKDPYTHGHSERVRDYSVMAARALGLSEHDIEVLRLGAALHDIGKVGVKDGVLNKVEPLTPDEWEMIRQHPVTGYDVLAHVPSMTSDHLHLVRWHHERIDGNGYPDRLKGESLPIITRVIVVADAYDAMASDRAYRKAMDPAQVIKEINRCAGAQFDTGVSRIFTDLIQSRRIPL